jgi:type I restriction enzyme, S subunit
MSGFTTVRLGDVLTFQRGFDITKNEQSEGDVPIVSSSGISSYHNQWKVKGPGVVIGRKGTLGTVHFVQSNYWPHDTTLWVKDFKGNDSRFLSYFIRTLKLENFDVGASNPTLNRNHVHKIKIVFPTNVDTQKKVSAILSAYDDLIENNKRQIALLEKLAEEIYREWFVRFRFPSQEMIKIVKGVPQGWEQKHLPEIANITYGFPFDGSRFNTEGRGKPIIRIRNIPESATSDFTDETAEDKYIVRHGDLLVGMDGEFHINHWHGDDALLVQRVCRMKAKNPVLEGYLARAIRAPIKHFESILMGATVGHLGAVHLKSIVLLVPPEPLHEHLCILNDIHRQKLLLAKAARNLGEIRDRLLPRLISGKLSVENLNILFPPSMAEELEPAPTASLHA